MKKLLLATFFILLSLPLKANDFTKFISQNSIAVGFITYDSPIIKEILPKEILEKFLDTNNYVIIDFLEGLIITYIPINLEWEKFVNSIENKKLLSEKSFILENYEDKKGWYIKKENEKYIGLTDKNLINNYNNVQRGLDKNTEGKVINFLKLLSNSSNSGIILHSKTLFSSLKINIPKLDNKYNFLPDIEYAYVIIPNDLKLYGKVFVSSPKKLKNLFVPRNLRKLNILETNIPFYLTLSLNPNLINDALEVLFPDIIGIYPSLTNEISKSLSGTVFINIKSQIYKQQDQNISVYIGIKDSLSAQKLIKTFLGILGKYKPLSISGKRVFEIQLQGSQNYVYLYQSEKEIVLTTYREEIEKYLSQKQSPLTITKFPTFEISGDLNYIIDVEDTLKRNSLDPSLSNFINKLKITFDIEDNLNTIEFNATFE